LILQICINYYFTIVDLESFLVPLHYSPQCLKLLKANFFKLPSNPNVGGSGLPRAAHGIVTTTKRRGILLASNSIASLEVNYYSLRQKSKY